MPKLALNSRALFCALFFPCWIVFFITAQKTLPYHIDPLTHIVTGWQLSQTGSPEVVGRQDLAEPKHFQNIGWFRETPNGAIGNYPPGNSWFIAAAYFVWPFELSADSMHIEGNNRPMEQPLKVELPPLLPPAALSSLIAALTSALMGLLFAKLGSSRDALFGGFLFAFGTCTWAVASEMTWHHGPAMLLIATALFLSATKHLWLSGLAFGLAILTRPPVAIIAAVKGVSHSLEKRSLLGLIQLGTGATLGLIGLLYYNSVWFSGPSISGGYGPQMANNLITVELTKYLKNIVWAFFDSQHGLLPYCPFLVFLIPGFASAWRKAEPWVRGGAVGGLLYWLVILKANRFSGGTGYFGYRYPLEMLTAAAPFLFLAYLSIKEKGGKIFRLFCASSVAATFFQLLYFALNSTWARLT